MSTGRSCFELRGARVDVLHPAGWADLVRGLLPALATTSPEAAPVTATLRFESDPAGGWVVRGPAVGSPTPAVEAAAALTLLEASIVEVLVGAVAGVIPLHAAAFEAAGRAVVLAGPSGSGKSTLAAAAARTGAPVLGDDVVLLDPADGRVLPVPRPFKVEGPAVALLGLDPPSDPRAPLRPDPAQLGAAWSRGAPLGLLALTGVRPGGAPVAMEPLDAADAIPAVLRQIARAGPLAGPDFTALADALDAVLRVRVRFADPGAAVRALAALVEPEAGASRARIR
ncbi:MAG: hypothetical protein D6701_14340 [Gemmatimonadetes bacterium]|nr:MAG: hypothetical protein D6701_14340 [Gemmatimonadota bacterium]